MQYMLFSSVPEDADMWSQKTSERVSVFINTKKGFPFKRLWDTKNTFFRQMEFYYR